ncbi:PAS domain-containing sensor histidine kinase [Flavobacterium sp. H122]|uniref:PAS domain-containing sensor histidine kinase n=1 Tax=Flavobacterium sp. H122 TaxID=2529860 RepID=UPI00145ACEB7|nr:PAS domain-containing sensor histidine kinase [Flavobacterium sp. H122]
MKKIPYFAKEKIDLERLKYAVFDNMIEGVQVIDFDWRYYYVNKSITVQGLSTQEELLGNTMMEKYPGIEKTIMFKSLQKCMYERTPSDVLSEFDFPDGSKGWFELSIQAVPEGILILSSDITKLKRAEFELKKKLDERNEMLSQIVNQKKQLEEFCQIISHNLRAPLSNLFLIGELLAENHSLEEKFNYFEMQRPIIKSLQSTFEELVQATQIKMDSTIKKEKIDLEKITTRLILLLNKKINHTNASISYDFSEFNSIFYSKKYLKNILINLLDNAIKYCSPERKPKIHLKSYKNNDWFCIDIEDNGLGIDLEKYKKDVFKLHKTFHNHPKAKGFGLFITKIQVESLGGSINVNSYPNQGSVFTIKLYRTKNEE